MDGLTSGVSWLLGEFHLTGLPIPGTIGYKKSPPQAGPFRTRPFIYTKVLEDHRKVAPFKITHQCDWVTESNK